MTKQEAIYQLEALNAAFKGLSRAVEEQIALVQTADDNQDILLMWEAVTGTPEQISGIFGGKAK